MFIDLSLNLSPERLAFIKKSGGLEGHLGTHFDVMDKGFPIESFRTVGRIFDISALRDREVEIADIGPIGKGETILFHTGLLDELGFENPLYWRRSADLSDDLVGHLLDHEVRFLGVDAAGAQKPKKHVAVDQRCADGGAFIIENMDNLSRLLPHQGSTFTLYTAPLHQSGTTGLPCRVIAEVSAPPSN